MEWTRWNDARGTQEEILEQKSLLTNIYN